MQRNLFRVTHLFIYRTCKRKTNYLESCIWLLTAQISTSIRTTLTKEFKHTNSRWLQGLRKQPRHFRANWCIPTTHCFYISTHISVPWTSLQAPPTSHVVQTEYCFQKRLHCVDTLSQVQGQIQITLHTVQRCVQKLQVVHFSLHYING